MESMESLYEELTEINTRIREYEEEEIYLEEILSTTNGNATSFIQDLEIVHIGLKDLRRQTSDIHLKIEKLKLKVKN